MYLTKGAFTRRPLQPFKKLPFFNTFPFRKKEKKTNKDVLPMPGLRWSSTLTPLGKRKRLPGA